MHYDMRFVYDYYMLQVHTFVCKTTCVSIEQAKIFGQRMPENSSACTKTSYGLRVICSRTRHRRLVMSSHAYVRSTPNLELIKAKCNVLTTLSVCRCREPNMLIGEDIGPFQLFIIAQYCFLN